MLGNMCRKRQQWRNKLAVKSLDCISWYNSNQEVSRQVQSIRWVELTAPPPTKNRWKVMVIRCVNGYWYSMMKFYSSLKYLNTEDYSPVKKHWLIQHAREVRDVTRLKTKLKLATGSYTLHVNRACFNQNKVEPTCMIYRNGDETAENTSYCHVTSLLK